MKAPKGDVKRSNCLHVDFLYAMQCEPRIGETRYKLPCQSHISNIKSILPVEAEISVTKVFITAKMKNSKSRSKQEVDVR